MDIIPDSQECIQLLKKNNCSIEVINHCISVKNLAIKIAERTNADIKLVEAGALLHDIGRSKTHGISHAIEGAKIAKQLNLSNKIINIIERHIGAGLPSDIAKKLGLPNKDFIPLTIEEKIVCHADNLIEDNKKQVIEIEIERALRENKKDYAIRLVNLHKELSYICGIDLNKI
jgi:tRNA (cytidine56-2'-O)-methyltransferase